MMSRARYAAVDLVEIVNVFGGEIGEDHAVGPVFGDGAEEGGAILRGESRGNAEIDLSDGDDGVADSHKHIIGIGAGAFSAGAASR